MKLCCTQRDARMFLYTYAKTEKVCNAIIIHLIFSQDTIFFFNEKEVT